MTLTEMWYDKLCFNVVLIEAAVTWRCNYLLHSPVQMRVKYTKIVYFIFPGSLCYSLAFEYFVANTFVCNMRVFFKMLCYIFLVILFYFLYIFLIMFSLFSRTTLSIIWAIIKGGNYFTSIENKYYLRCVFICRLGFEWISVILFM